MNQPTMKYDSQVDILRIRLNDSPIEDSERANDHLIIDYDADGNVVGFEILDISDVTRAQSTDVITERSA